MGKKKITLTLIYALILSALTFSLYITLAIIINDKDTLGEVCFIVCSLSYISPTQLLIKVLNKKDYRIIPIISAIISGLGFGSWSIFGLFQFSATIIIPNLVGFIFSAAQIILYRVYKNKRPLEEEIGNISTSVIGAVKNVVERTVEIANNINQKTQNDNNKVENGETNNTNVALDVKKDINEINFDTNNVTNQNQNQTEESSNNNQIGDFDFNTDDTPQNNQNNNIQNNPDINNNI
jgi:ABC-type xylose transport system permease subunit